MTRRYNSGNPRPDSGISQHQGAQLPGWEPRRVVTYRGAEILEALGQD
jgi:hypothetical protein